jgi:plastocyanin
MRPLAIFLLLAPTAASGGTLRGTIFFPQDAKLPEPKPLANWRVENGVLPIVPPTPESRTEAIVVLEPAKPVEPPTAKVVVEAKGLKLDPKVAIGAVGSTFDFKNGDRVAHTLFLKDGESFMGAEPTAPGKAREVKFTVAGVYEVRDADYPHARATLLVVPTSWFGHSDDKGSFKLDAPDGKYTLKVFFRGVWAASQPVEVGRSGEVLVRLTLPDDGGRR